MTPQEILSTYSRITEERKKEHGIYPGMVNDAWVATCEELLKGKDEEIEKWKKLYELTDSQRKEWAELSIRKEEARKELVKECAKYQQALEKITEEQIPIDGWEAFAYADNVKSIAQQVLKPNP